MAQLTGCCSGGPRFNSQHTHMVAHNHLSVSGTQCPPPAPGMHVMRCTDMKAKHPRDKMKMKARKHSQCSLRRPHMWLAASVIRSVWLAWIHHHASQFPQ